MWLYRYFKRNVANTQITLDSSVTGGLNLPSATLLGVNSTATPYFYKFATIGFGSSVIDWWVGATGQWQLTPLNQSGPTPSHLGDMLFSSYVGVASTVNGGRIYVAEGTTSSADWKIVTQSLV